MAEDNTFSNLAVRLERRMVATGSGSIEQYAACLEDDPGEYRNLSARSSSR